MDEIDFSSIGISLQQAHLNEYKGNLFEFLIGLELAKHFKMEWDYYQTYNQQMLQKLGQYERNLGMIDQGLKSQLEAMAQKTAHHLLDKIQSEYGTPIKIKVIGKEQKENWKESDLVLEFKDRPVLAVSIKLCKRHSFINTKSGGAQSFLSQYFTLFNDASVDQELFNLKLQDQYNVLVKDLYQMVGMDDSNIDRPFGPEWTQQYSELPGQLPMFLRSRLFQFYSVMIVEFKKNLEKYYLQNKTHFIQCLMPIVGLGRQDLWQIFYLYDQQQDQVLMMGQKQYQKEFEELKFVKHNDDISSFELQLKNIQLQIRLKPMNKFTVPGLKVNCSIKMSHFTAD